MTKQSKKWNSYSGKAIPSSSELFPVAFNYIKKRSRILDLGCGYGKTVAKLYKKGYVNAFGADVNNNGIEYAREQAQAAGLKKLASQFVVSDALKLPFKNSSFDCVMTQAFWTSILPGERRKIMGEIRRVLKPGGTFYAAIWAQTWRTPLYAKRYREGMRKGLPEGSFEVKDPDTGKTRYVAHHFSEREIVEMFEQGGMAIEEYLYESAKTQHGQSINCHVVIAKTLARSGSR